jgi:hypothetical protein
MLIRPADEVGRCLGAWRGHPLKSCRAESRDRYCLSGEQTKLGGCYALAKSIHSHPQASLPAHIHVVRDNLQQIRSCIPAIRVCQNRDLSKELGMRPFEVIQVVISS